MNRTEGDGEAAIGAHDACSDLRGGARRKDGDCGPCLAPAGHAGPAARDQQVGGRCGRRGIGRSAIAAAIAAVTPPAIAISVAITAATAASSRSRSTHGADTARDGQRTAKAAADNSGQRRRFGQFIPISEFIIIWPKIGTRQPHFTARFLNHQIMDAARFVRREIIWDGDGFTIGQFED